MIKDEWGIGKEPIRVSIIISQWLGTWTGHRELREGTKSRVSIMVTEFYNNLK